MRIDGSGTEGVVAAPGDDRALTAAQHAGALVREPDPDRALARRSVTLPDAARRQPARRAVRIQVAAAADPRTGVAVGVEQLRQARGDHVRGRRPGPLRLELVLVAGGIVVVEVVDAARRQAPVEEGARQAAEGPGRDLVADHVVGKSNREAVRRARMPDRDRRVRPLRTARVLDPPGAAVDQRREGLARIGDQLQVGADADDRGVGAELIAEPTGGLAGEVRLPRPKQPRRRGRLEQVVLERDQERVALDRDRAHGELTSGVEVARDRARERLTGRLRLRVAAAAALRVLVGGDRGDRARILLGAVVGDEEHRHAGAEAPLQSVVEIARPVGGDLAGERRRVADLLIVSGEVHHRHDRLAVRADGLERADDRVDRRRVAVVVGGREVLRQVHLEIAGDREAAGAQRRRLARVVGLRRRLRRAPLEEVHVVLVDARVDADGAAEHGHVVGDRGCPVDAERIGRALVVVGADEDVVDRRPRRLGLAADRVRVVLEQPLGDDRGDDDGVPAGGDREGACLDRIVDRVGAVVDPTGDVDPVPAAVAVGVAERLGRADVGVVEGTGAVGVDVGLLERPLAGAVEDGCRAGREGGRSRARVGDRRRADVHTGGADLVAGGRCGGGSAEREHRQRPDESPVQSP